MKRKWGNLRIKFYDERKNGGSFKSSIFLVSFASFCFLGVGFAGSHMIDIFCGSKNFCQQAFGALRCAWSQSMNEEKFVGCSRHNFLIMNGQDHLLTVWTVRRLHRQAQWPSAERFPFWPAGTIRRKRYF